MRTETKKKIHELITLTTHELQALGKSLGLTG